MTATAAREVRYSTSIPAVTFETVTGGIRVRREGKGDTLFVTRDENCRRPAWLVIQHGVGVVGRIGAPEPGDYVLEFGIFRHWDQVGTPWQCFPSSTVRTEWYGSMDDAMAEAALFWCS
jgi:hypothetical protein